MSALSRFEQFMESMVEDSVARLFRSPVQPAEIAKRLERAMESNQTISVRRVIVPHLYRVYLHPQDYRDFPARLRLDLEREMATYLNDLALERKFTLLEHPKVQMSEDPAVPRRTIQVAIETADPHAGDANSSTQVLSATGQQHANARNGRTAALLIETTGGMHRMPLASTLLTIGRGLNNDIILEDTRVSRNHAQLRYKSRRFWINDLSTTNGTFINGERISEADLRHGDVISLGGLELTFEEG